MNGVMPVSNARKRFCPVDFLNLPVGQGHSPRFVHKIAFLVRSFAFIQPRRLNRAANESNGLSCEGRLFPLWPAPLRSGSKQRHLVAVMAGTV
jgi:hypothetical protein